MGTDITKLTSSYVSRLELLRIRLLQSYQQTYGQRRRHYLPFRVDRLLLSGNCPARRGTVCQFIILYALYNSPDGQAQVRVRGTFCQLCSKNAYMLAELTFMSSLLTSTTWAHSFLGACLSCFLGAGGAGNRYKSAQSQLTRTLWLTPIGSRSSTLFFDGPAPLLPPTS